MGAHVRVVHLRKTRGEISPSWMVNNPEDKLMPSTVEPKRRLDWRQRQEPSQRFDRCARYRFLLVHLGGAIAPHPGQSLTPEDCAGVVDRCCPGKGSPPFPHKWRFFVQVTYPLIDYATGFRQWFEVMVGSHDLKP